MNRIVIIGGMGPQASLELHQRIIAVAASLGATNNNDYPLIVHLSIPVKDFISEQDSKQAQETLIDELKNFSFLPSDKIIIACNTAHLLKPMLERLMGVSIASLMELAAEAIAEQDKTIGLVASPTTISSGLYAKPLKRGGHKILTPSETELSIVEQSIRSVIANIEPSRYRKKVTPTIDSLISQGATKVILGCTELSLIFKGTDRLDIVDPLQLAADYLVAD